MAIIDNLELPVICPLFNDTLAESLWLFSNKNHTHNLINMRMTFFMSVLITVVIALTGCKSVNAQVDDPFFSSFIQDEATYLSQEI